MNASPETCPFAIRPDTRAYMILLAVFSPLFVLWGLMWLRKGYVIAPPIILIAALVVLALYQLRNKTLMLGDSEIVQGWPPFRTTIQYHEIARIHHIFVSSRYASSPCLAISSAEGNKQILLPMKSFSLDKRRRLVKFLRVRAPQARIDHDE
jgi:hypothetical protein